MAEVHAYSATCSWSGSTGEGYERYSRSHRLAAPPAGAQVAASADPHFGGDPERLNPEQLLVMAAASCQMLSFLAICARARIDVRAYEDAAEGIMPGDDPPMRIARIVLRPRITVAGDVAEERLRRYFELAHRECFVARSLRTEIELEPRFETA
jgi:organic hydroperoxide reductase OsmC/OhrA